MIAINNASPKFDLYNQHGVKICSDDYIGKNLVLYFYPKALTPGCTQQAINFQSQLNTFASIDTEIIGVSPDKPDLLKKFADKHHISFNLLSDPDLYLCKAYNVWQLKKFMGKEYMGVVRSSFILDRAGVLRRSIEKVKVKGHNNELLTFIRENLT